MAETTLTVAKLRIQFFNYLFGDENPGYICIATSEPDRAKTSFKQSFFKWPSQKNTLGSFIEQSSKSKNVWFCVNLLDEQKRSKEHCMPSNLVWADLDLITPDDCDPKPTAAVKSSPGRFQAFWRLDTSILPPDVCEDYSRRIAYKVGADKSGWDLTQLLRVPFTRNFKYDDGPLVELLYAAETRAPVSIFEKLPDPKIIDLEATRNPLDDPPEGMPAVDSLPSSGQVIYKYTFKLAESGFMALYGEIPHSSDDWSRRMWRMIMICLEAGMDTQEVFSVALTAECNKYTRDNRPPSYLWREIVKADGINRRSMSDTGQVKPLIMPILVDPEDVQDEIQGNFIAEYKKWASEATDAIEEYHELCCFMLLSSMLCSGLYLNTSWGELAPNLWGLVLGDSTLTRKTTAMNMAKDILLEIDPDILLATDGSAEGLVTGLSGRPERVSMFFRDEVAGFFDAINKKDYLAGLPQLLTELYDVPRILIRQLRKDTITITKPYFVFFGGGIKEKVHNLLTEDFILSGFMPRFLIVSGDTDLTRIRRTGPANAAGTEDRANIMDRVKRLHSLYNQRGEMTIAGQPVLMARRYEAQLSQEAWDTFGEYEENLTRVASASPNSMLALPTFTRLAFSLLKMSLILAAAESDPNSDNSILKVEVTHIRQAAYYVQKWGKYSIQMIENSGISFNERAINKAMAAIRKTPGMPKSRLMTNHRMSSREVKEVLETMHDRGMIRVEKDGKGLYLWPND